MLYVTCTLRYMHTFWTLRECHAGQSAPGDPQCNMTGCVKVHSARDAIYDIDLKNDLFTIYLHEMSGEKLEKNNWPFMFSQMLHISL